MFKSTSRIQIFRDTTWGNVFFLRDEVKIKEKVRSYKWIIKMNHLMVLYFYFEFFLFFKQYKTITIKDRRISLSSSLIIVYNLSFVRRKWRRLELYRMVFPVRIRTYRIKKIQMMISLMKNFTNPLWYRSILFLLFREYFLDLKCFMWSHLKKKKKKS